MSSKLHMNDAINLSRLPVWAQKHIESLQRERDVAVRALNEYCDKETPAPFVFEDMVCTGEEQEPSFKVRYVQARNMGVHHQGIVLRVGIRHDGISLQYSTKSWVGPVRLTPESFQSFRLSPERSSELEEKLCAMAKDAGKLIGGLRERMSNCPYCTMNSETKTTTCAQCKRDQKVIDEASK